MWQSPPATLPAQKKARVEAGSVHNNVQLSLADATAEPLVSGETTAASSGVDSAAEVVVEVTTAPVGGATGLEATDRTEALTKEKATLTAAAMSKPNAQIPAQAEVLGVAQAELDTQFEMNKSSDAATSELASAAASASLGASACAAGSDLVSLRLRALSLIVERMRVRGEQLSTARLLQLGFDENEIMIWRADFGRHIVWSEAPIFVGKAINTESRLALEALVSGCSPAIYPSVCLWL